MSRIEKNVSPFIDLQFPEFYRENGKNLVAFVKAYYEWLESENNALNHSRSLLDYADIDQTEAQFIDYFRKTYLSSIPNEIAADDRLLVKHVLDLYRSKGSKRAVELLFRILFNEDIEVFVPGDYLLRPSDGDWNKTRYIETTSHPNLSRLVGKTITSSDGTTVAVVENSFRKVVGGKTVNVIYLSSIRGQFRYGDKIICDGLIEIEDAPIITGSLTAIAIENGGARFNTGDILSVSGSGSEGKARVAAVRDENGKVRFTLVNGGSGYSINPTITVATTLSLEVSDTTGTFVEGTNVYSTATSANGNLVFANSSYLTLINFSTTLSFTPGDTITDGTATATIQNVIGGGGTGASFQIGGLVNKEILRINTDKISDRLATRLQTQVQVNTGTQTAAFTVGNRVVSSANVCVLQVTYEATTNTAQIGEKLSNTALGIANLYVYNSDAGIVYVTGTESDLTNVNLVSGTALVGNISNVTARLNYTPIKEVVVGNGTVFSTNTSTVTANVMFESSYFVPTARLTDSGNPSANATIISQISLTNWSFPKRPLPSISNLDNRIDEVLNINDLEVGTIAFLSNINPGDGYSSPPYVDIIEPEVALINEIDDTGGVKGHNAVVDVRVSSEQGIVTAVDVYDSGFGYVPGESVFLSKDGSDVVVSGVAVIETGGTGTGYWLGKKGFLSDIMKIQDSDYYQIYSYEVIAKRMIDTYEKLVNDLVHPAGYKLFGRYRSSELLTDDVSLLANSSTSQSNTTTYTVVDRNFIANTATFTRASNATFLNAVMLYENANTNVPRFDFSGVATYAGFLNEGARTNTFTNPRMQGGIPGIPGTQPSAMGAWNLSTSGLTMEYVQNVSYGNMTGVRYRLFGTAAATASVSNLFAPSSTGWAASPGENWTGSVFIAVLNGIGTLNNFRLSMSARAGGATAGTSASGSLLSSLTTVPTRFAQSYANLPATTTGLFHQVILGVTSGVVVDVTFDLYWPQLELGEFATSPILPPVGTVAATTRAADLLNVPLSSYGIDIDGDCTVLVSGLMPTAYPTGAAAPLINLRRSGSNSAGALGLHPTNLGRMTLAARNVAGGNITTELASTDFRGQFVRAGLVVSSGTATVRGCVAGGPVGSVVWRPDSTPAVARIGSSWTGGSGADTMALFGEIRTVQILPYALSDSALQAAVAALPS